MKWWLVFGFGGIGAVARLALVGLFPVSAAPWGTLLVNGLGCLAIGVLFEWFEERDILAPALRMGLVAGLLGGFTTFSAFGIEVLDLLEARRWLAGLSYAGGSVVLGVVAAAAGAVLARQVL